MARLSPAGPEVECLSEVTAAFVEFLVYSAEPGQWWDFYLRALRKSA